MSIRGLLGIENYECVLIGSRGLGVNDSSSDYDIVMAYDDVPEDLIGVYRCLNLDEYFEYVPLGNNKLMKISNYKNKLINIDLILLDDRKNINIYKDVMKMMKDIPKIILEDKFLRVKIFEHILCSKGFVNKKLQLF